MNWFVIALGCAFLTACSDAVSKRIMWEHDEWITGAALLAISATILAPLLLFQELKPVSTELALLILISLPLEISSYYLFLSAIRMADMSLTLPLLAFTPVLTILTAALLLGESISATGGMGIALVTVGAYLLNGDLAHRSLFAPIKAIFSTSGCRRMLLVAVLWSLTSTLGKKGILLYGAYPVRNHPGNLPRRGSCRDKFLAFKGRVKPDNNWQKKYRAVPSGRVVHGRSADYTFCVIGSGARCVHDFRKKAQPRVWGYPGPAPL